jgi:probable addiction module antidote protein
MTAIKTMPFDAAKYLDDDETQAELLSEALATGDRRTVIHAIATIARARGMTSLASKTGIGRTTLYRMIEEDGNPSIDGFLKIVSALNISLQAKPATPEIAA